MTIKIQDQEITLIPVPCSGGSILLGPDHQDYARYLAARAELRSTRPWVTELDSEGLALVRDVWAATAPGWLGDDRSITALHAHSGIMHHVKRAGHRYLTAEQTRALHILADHSDMDVSVSGCMPGAEYPQTYVLSDLVLADGSLTETDRVLDHDDFDEWDGVGGYRYNTVARAGESAARYVIRSAEAVKAQS